MNQSKMRMGRLGERQRGLAENLANADLLATTPDGDPDRRKTVTFRSALERQLGADLVEVSRIVRDNSERRNGYDS